MIAKYLPSYSKNTLLKRKKTLSEEEKSKIEELRHILLVLGKKI